MAEQVSITEVRVDPDRVLVFFADKSVIEFSSLAEARAFLLGELNDTWMRRFAIATWLASDPNDTLELAPRTVTFDLTSLTPVMITS